MQLIHSISSLRLQISDWKQQGFRIGFVPTMGSLHAGHLSLVALAKQKADKVVVSIFVNPLQFGPNEDFEAYPRSLEDDAKQCEISGVDLVFAPSVSDMYPSPEQVMVKMPSALTDVLEGASRPGHFDGVTTVVAKLFNMVQPDVAVFGQKDYQQWCVLSQMVVDLAMPVEMVCAPIARAEDGLALSSRNQYLTPEQRAIAPALYCALQEVQLAIQQPRSFLKHRAIEQQAVESLLAAGFDSVDYVKIVNAKTLRVPESEAEPLIVLAVARMGVTRLLDNLLLRGAC